MNRKRLLSLLFILPLLSGCRLDSTSSISESSTTSNTSFITSSESSVATTSFVSSSSVEEKDSVFSSIDSESHENSSKIENSSFEESSSSNMNFQVIKLDSSNEKIALSFSGDKPKEVYYSLDGETEIKVDEELIYDEEIFIPGLKKGSYTLRIVDDQNEEMILSSIEVSAIDRSGYAHFHLAAASGFGGYKDDGTLKDDAQVIYVNDNNKNTVQLKIGNNTYTGLVNILNHSKNLTTPVVIRFMDTIKTNQFKPKSVEEGKEPFDDVNYFYNEKEDTYTELNGLSSKIWAPSTIDVDRAKQGGVTEVSTVSKSKDTDSAFNNCKVANVSNMTIEGVSSTAGLLNWGFTFQKCAFIELRNLTFSDYTEDACSFEGSQGNYNKSTGVVEKTLDTNYQGYFLHHCTFNRGKNNWDLTQEQDKHDGDGSADLKKLSNVTFAYNHFYNCHKTGLIGGGNEQMTRNVTFHHNYYEKCQSRLPLGRQVNLHCYNNYYLNCGNCQDMRANSFTFSEANYFENCTSPQLATSDSVFSSTIIKSYQDVIVNASKASQASVALTREQSFTANCCPDGENDYSNFDTSSTLFYYDEVNKVSNVSLLESASNGKTTCMNLSGSYH